MSNWLLVAEPGNYAVAAMLSALEIYFETHTGHVSYFIFHELFEAMCHLDDRFRAVIEAMTPIGHHGTHSLQRRITAPIDLAEFLRIAWSRPAHKLSYKLKSDPLPGSLASIFAGAGPAAR